MAFTHHQLIALALASFTIIGCNLGQNQETRQHVGKTVPKISLVSLDTEDETLIVWKDHTSQFLGHLVPSVSPRIAWACKACLTARR